MGNGVVSKLRKTSRAGHLTFVPECAAAVIAIAVYRKEDVDLLVSQRISRDQLLAEIWGGETAEQNVPEKIEGEPEHDRCEPAVAQKKPALEYVGEIKRLRG